MAGDNDERCLAGGYKCGHLEGAISVLSPGLLRWECQALMQDWECHSEAEMTYNANVCGAVITFKFEGGTVRCGTADQIAAGIGYIWTKSVPAPELQQDLERERRLAAGQVEGLAFACSMNGVELKGHFQKQPDQTYTWTDTSGNTMSGYVLEGDSTLKTPSGFFFDVEVGPDGNVSAVVCNGAFRWVVVKARDAASRRSAKWSTSVPEPPICSRDSWKGVFRGAPEELLSGLHKGNHYVHPMYPLQPGIGSFEESGSNPEGFQTLLSTVA